jgi:hypothetical protein
MGKGVLRGKDHGHSRVELATSLDLGPFQSEDTNKTNDNLHMVQVNPADPKRNMTPARRQLLIGAEQVPIDSTVPVSR